MDLQCHVIKWSQPTDWLFKKEEAGNSYRFVHLICNKCVTLRFKIQVLYVQIRCVLSLVAYSCNWNIFYVLVMLQHRGCGTCAHALSSLTLIKVYTGANLFRIALSGCLRIWRTPIVVRLMSSHARQLSSYCQIKTLIPFF